MQICKFELISNIFHKVSSGMSQEEARRRVEAIEDKHATELARLEERNRELRSSLLESTYENTTRLREVADLSSRQFTLEKVRGDDGCFSQFRLALKAKTRPVRPQPEAGGGALLDFPVGLTVASGDTQLGAARPQQGRKTTYFPERHSRCATASLTHQHAPPCLCPPPCPESSNNST